MLDRVDYKHCIQQSLKISVDLYHSGQNSFYSSLKKMTDYYDFPGFNCNLLNKCKIKQYVDLMQKKYISYPLIGGAGSEVWNRVYMIAPVKKFGRVRLSTIFLQNKYGGECRLDERLNTGMAPTCNWRIKIVII